MKNNMYNILAFCEISENFDRFEISELFDISEMSEMLKIQIYIYIRVSYTQNLKGKCGSSGGAKKPYIIFVDQFV